MLGFWKKCDRHKKGKTQIGKLAISWKDLNGKKLKSTAFRHGYKIIRRNFIKVEK